MRSTRAPWGPEAPCPRLVHQGFGSHHPTHKPRFFHSPLLSLPESQCKGPHLKLEYLIASVKTPSSNKEAISRWALIQSDWWSPVSSQKGGFGHGEHTRRRGVSTAEGHRDCQQPPEAGERPPSPPAARRNQSGSHPKLSLLASRTSAGIVRFSGSPSSLWYLPQPQKPHCLPWGGLGGQADPESSPLYFLGCLGQVTHFPEPSSPHLC